MPAKFVVRTVTTPVSVLVIVTVAPGITAPVASVTVPRRSLEFVLCAKLAMAAHKNVVHKTIVPPLGFFFGQPAAHELLRKPHGRIVFAHSELQGNMNMAHAMLEGRRGALQAMDLMSS